MKNILNILIVLTLVILLTACSPSLIAELYSSASASESDNDSESLTDESESLPESVENAPLEIENKSENDEFKSSQGESTSSETTLTNESYNQMEIMTIDFENFANAIYKEDGVHVEFSGSNEFESGYAVIEGAKTLHGEATFWENGYQSGESRQIFFTNTQEVINVFSDLTFENVTQYYRDSDTKESLDYFFKGEVGVSNNWVAQSALMYPLDSEFGLEEEYINTQINLTTTYDGSVVNFQMSSDSEDYVLRTGSGYLEGEFYHSGLINNTAFSIHAYPDNQTLIVNFATTKSIEGLPYRFMTLVQFEKV